MTSDQDSSRLREELITPATKFLKDPKVSNSTLAKKIAFLESKGMTSLEIEEAMRRSKGDDQQQQHPPPIPPPTYAHIPTNQIVYGGSRWKDLFIVTTVVGGLGIGAYHLAKHFIPTWFDSGNDDQKETLLNALEEVREIKEKRELEVTKLSSELQELKDLIPQMLERSKETYSFALTELHGEIKSLKSLLLSRRSLAGLTPPTGVDDNSILPAKPAIPSWQMSLPPSQKALFSETVGSLSDVDPAQEEDLDHVDAEEKYEEVITQSLGKEEQFAAPVEQSIVQREE